MNKKIIAITGPSGSGKTTLTEALLSYYNILVPTHTTTRSRRIDDKDGFYRYLSCEEFELLKNKEQFLICSGANNRSYGVLKQDCFDAWQKTDTILLNVSYKDVSTLTALPYDVSLIALTFQNIEEGIMSRIHSTDRMLSNMEVLARIKGALLDHQKYFSLVENVAQAIIYTDEISQEETLKEAERALNLQRPKQKIYLKEE